MLTTQQAKTNTDDITNTDKHKHDTLNGYWRAHTRVSDGAKQRRKVPRDVVILVRRVAARIHDT